jgi:uncharacterized membrane protein
MVRALWVCVSFLSLIMVAVATRRIVHLRLPAVDLDIGFANHRILTLAHIIPGLAFIALGPFQFMSGLRKRRPGLHRWIGRIFLADAFAVGLTALLMSPQMAIGGTLESSATFTFAVLFLFALARGFIAIRAGRAAEHRRWVIRAYAIGLSVATVRPIAGVFFATSRITHLTPRDFFGFAFWLGFSLSLAAAEAWIRTMGGPRKPVSTASTPGRPRPIARGTN